MSDEFASSFALINSDENFLKKVITGDESWVYGYDPETKQQSSQWKHASSPRPKKARQSRSKIKSMLIVFFYYEGVVYHEYAPTGQTINKEYYVEILKRLRDAIRRKRPHFWQSGDWLLHHAMLQRIHRILYSSIYQSTGLRSFVGLCTVST